MRLADLNPEWYGASGRTGPNRLGVRFDCPACTAAGRLEKCEWGGSVYVPFANPLDGAPPLYDSKGWQRTGESFDDLTLSPSVDYCQGHWHGFVTNGEVTTC